ncbi:hypothetical protein PHLGIDRAFT_30911 [Phlebiopsis gigantea 11061_1 CR5-6]|uniref:PQ loop repeat protein n=1 Tax=Phlebiopsis gigantea (strain 11061_1 CR5-6) TaxID=745531 RepID=A0A0C3PHQ7_PHLG1|nr:hypothetical protein PHLGIDRAFT_30911 [Phlebiopsis gigantea 11061_1 CR5-6]
MSGTCEPSHDYFTDILTAGLCVGLVVSYLPQHLRIIYAKSSEGFSPWFLLLGSISSASAALNIVVKQWEVVKCCRVISVGSCIEETAGIFQLALLWFLFTMILVLYMMYYPVHLKYVTVDLDSQDGHPPQHVQTNVKQEEWRLSIALSWVVFLYTLLLLFVTFLLLGLPASSPRYTQQSLWATFLGLSSTFIAMFQYLPQIKHTYQHKVVGALSIPMMCIQTPGAVFMVLSIALRPGTNWTTWSTYAVAGVLQGSLLVMCIMWRARQRKLGIDDFGNPIEPFATPTDEPRRTRSRNCLRGRADGFSRAGCS